MPKYSPETKRAAESGQQAAAWTRSICGALGIEGRHYYLYLAAFFDLLFHVSGHIAADPPRPDFKTSTKVRPRLSRPDYISTDDRFEALALKAAAAADDAEAQLAAHLRAFERLQGASKANRRAEASARAEEARRYARSSGHALRQLAGPVAEIAAELSENSRPRQSNRDVRRGRPQVNQVSRDALAIFFLGGLRIRDLENVLHGIEQEDSSQAVRRLNSAAKTFREFGRTMEDWIPPQESEFPL